LVFPLSRVAAQFISAEKYGLGFSELLLTEIDGYAILLSHNLPRRPSMIKIGDRLPEGTLTESTEFDPANGCPLNPQPVAVADQVKGKRIVIFGVPGAFTPTCSIKHLPGYVAQFSALKAKGVDEIWCLAVNDAYVMAAWGRDQKATGKVRMMADGNAEYARKLGLDRDLSASSMGIRCYRFGMIVDDGVVKYIGVEASGKFEVSNAEAVLAKL